MDRKIKVLLLVGEVWRDDNSGGNTISNFFNGMEGVEFAQIYYEDGLPDNTICEKYYQIPQTQVIRNFLLHKKVGFVLKNKHHLPNIEQSPKNKSGSLVQQVRNLFVRVRPRFLITIKFFIWRYSNWKTPELESFVKEFNPDVIYAPCYASPFRLAITRYIKEITGKKIVTWSADDCYSLRQFSLSPFFWLNRFWNRHCLRKTYPYYDEFFSISEDEIEEMSPIVGLQMKILRKGVYVPESFEPRAVHQPIRLIYAGGLYLNRYKCLVEIANALRVINKDGVKAVLHIYTGSQLGKSISTRLNDGVSVINHGLVPSSELEKIYKASDVAIHCESFDLQNKLATRLSFSTKIIDCFQSGCAILAIAWKEQTGLKYLKNEDAAFCVTSVKDIESMVSFIINNPEAIRRYALKAYECEKRNHRIEDVQRVLYDSFLSCIK